LSLEVKRSVWESKEKSLDRLDQVGVQPAEMFAFRGLPLGAEGGEAHRAVVYQLAVEVFFSLEVFHLGKIKSQAVRKVKPCFA